jgi:glycosyltransferase involved in cell wall biosynthesis
MAHTKKKLQKKFPLVKFVGCKSGAELSAWYRNAKVFVFPSKTDTFGIVMIESLASGVPVAAYPVTGPLDIIQEGINGSLNDDLGCAISNAMQINREDCINSAQAYKWKNVAEQFLNTLSCTKSHKLSEFDKTSSVS